MKVFVTWAGDSTMQPDVTHEAHRIVPHLSATSPIGPCGGRLGWVTEYDEAGNRTAMTLYAEVIKLGVQYR